MAPGYQARLPAVAALLLAATTFARAEAPQPRPEQHPTCTFEAGPTRSVVRVIDAETVLLDDDEEVRLIGALAPRSPDLRPDAQSWPPEQDTAAALRDLVVGRSVELATSGRAKDRYGRLLAHLFLDDNGDRVWVQGRLLSTGHARAYGLPDNFACAGELLAHERVARAAGIGLWANAAYATRKADDAGQAPALSQQLSDRRRQRRAREGSESAHLSRLRPRLAHRFLGRHRRQDSARQPRVGQDAGRARGPEGRGARLDRIPQRALHRDRGPEPARRHRRKRAAIRGVACARWPGAQQRAAKWAESANEPHKRKRPAHKVPGVDL